MKNEILYESMFKNKISCNYPFKNEVSLLKKIDIKHLDFFKDIIKKNKLKIRIRYRGPSTSSYTIHYFESKVNKKMYSIRIITKRKI